MNLWNVKDLTPPPISSCKVVTKEVDIRLLDGVLKNGVQFFENQNHLKTEAALLSRLVYRLKMKFRSSKDFKYIEKLSRILRNYIQMQMSNIFKMLQDSLPKNYKAHETYMLTKNMVDYVLVSIQGLGKTLCRVLQMCKEVAALIQQRLRLGHFWKVAVIVFATTARIFVISKSILKYSCEMYSNLLPFSSRLQNSGVQWLPENYVFPDRLDEWLDIDWLEFENDVIEVPDDDGTLSYFKLTDSDDEVEFCDEYILVKDDSELGDILVESEEADEDLIELENSVISLDDSKLSTNQNETEDENIIIQEDNKSTIQENEISNVEEVINISDVESNTPQKKKRKRSRLQQIEEEFDIGEEIGTEELTELRGFQTPKRKKLKGHVATPRKKRSKVKITHGHIHKTPNKNKNEDKKRKKRKKKKSLMWA